MTSIDRARLNALESRLGAKFPADFLATLSNREPIREGNVVLNAHDRVWDIRTTFKLDDGDQSDQLDSVYKLVGDVLPIGMLPFAEDWGGNLYCIVLTGNSAGKVVWWDHERDDDDDSVVAIAESILELYSNLVPDPRD